MPQGYDDLEFLGRGSFGTVSKVRRQRDGKILACKAIPLNRIPLDYVRTEIRVLQNSTHRHIVNIEGWGVANASNVVYIFMEFCNGGDLQKLINTHQRSRAPIAERRILSFARQIALALAYLHSPNNGRGITLHRDLKPANVLLKAEQVGYIPTIKLTDFGVARTMQRVGGTFCGTVDYMAPELHAATARRQPLPFSTKSDVYALGKIIEELYRAGGNAGSRSAGIPVLIRACLKAKPAERPTAQAIANWCLARQ